MQRTRDRVGLHGKAPGREPLIFVVLAIGYTEVALGGPRVN
jgi:hypothetical protein